MFILPHAVTFFSLLLDVFEILVDVGVSGTGYLRNVGVQRIGNSTTQCNIQMTPPWLPLLCVLAALPAVFVLAAPDLTGHWVYHSRDGGVIPIYATLTCTNNCGSDAPVYTGTLIGTSIVLGVFSLNNNYIGWGNGPSPQIMGGCTDDEFTIMVADDEVVRSMLVGYQPCNTFVGGSSVYSRLNQLPTKEQLQHQLTNVQHHLGAASSHQARGPLQGSYVMRDRNPPYSSSALKVVCLANCDSSQTQYAGYFGNGNSFLVNMLPDNNVGFGTATLGSCVSNFTLIVPPTGVAAGSVFLAAAQPSAACGFAGSAFRVTTA
jgi:hypothetical protein